MPSPLIACIGGAHLDRRALLPAPAVLGTSNPGTVYTDLGGVARNVAQNLDQLGCRVLLCSRVGNDDAGRRVLAQPLDSSLISLTVARPTASYTAILEPAGELVIGVADMEIYEELMPAVLIPALPLLRDAALWFLDANLPAQTIAWLIQEAGAIPVAVDAISVAKSRRLLPVLSQVRYCFCNLAQAGAMAGETFFDAAAAAQAVRNLGAASGVVSAGAKGVAVHEPAGITCLPALRAAPRDVTGAGDALVAGTLYGLCRHLELTAAACLGLAAAAITVESANSVAPQLTAEALYARA